MTVEKLDLSICFTPKSECYQLWTDSLPILAAFIALIGAWVAFYGVRRQLRHSIDVTRYEAVRHKRAIAKALLQEITELTERISRGTQIEPTVYPDVLAHIGRLDTDSIGDIVRFYSAYKERPTADKDKLVRLGDQAKKSLETFLNEKTARERDYLSTIFKKSGNKAAQFEEE